MTSAKIETLSVGDRPLKRLLLVYPYEGDNATAIDERAQRVLGINAVAAPLAAVTIAALTPPEIDVEIWDENVRGKVDEVTRSWEYDLVGISGFSLHYSSVIRVSAFFRELGTPIVLGGSGVSVAPEDYVAHGDVLFIGEAELTWPQFVQDWKRGEVKTEYRTYERPDFTTSPPPRWDLIKEDILKYAMVGLQTTRGCPFNCEFCDIVYLFGRKPRHKDVDQVMKEFKSLAELGVRTIFITDDNFIGHPDYAKTLLQEFAAYNNSLRRPMLLKGQVSLNLAKDEELLTLMADANFSLVTIGIESPNPESLVEMQKSQNKQVDIGAAVRKIQSYGIPVAGSMIVGFDADDSTIFDKHLSLIDESYFAFANTHMLSAPRGTRLWARLAAQGRVVREDALNEGPGSSSNIIPKQMTRAELAEGFLELVFAHSHPTRSFKRIRQIIKGLARVPKVRRTPLYVLARAEGLRSLRLFHYFIIRPDGRFSGAVRREVLKTVLYTLWKAPFFMERVLQMMVQAFGYNYRLQTMTRPLLTAALQQEAKEGLQIVQPLGQIPNEFLDFYKGVFPELAALAIKKLDSQDGLHEVLTHTVVDYLSGYGDHPPQVDGKLKWNLLRLCEENIEKYKLEQAGFPGLGSSKKYNPRSAILRDEVLRAIEQELRRRTSDSIDSQGASEEAAQATEKKISGEVRHPEGSRGGSDLVARAALPV